MQHEKRKSVRRSLKYPAWIDAEDGSDVRPCAIVDVSSKGARILFDGPAPMIDLLVLVLARRGSRRRCRVVWRSDAELGLQFVKPVAVTANPA